MDQNLNQEPSEETASLCLPEELIYLTRVAPTIQLDIRYATENNFVGCPINRYEAPVSILSIPAAQAVATVQKEILPLGISLKIFDRYRPQRAVDHFIRWAQDASDHRTKSEYYPHIPKEKLLELGYIFPRSRF